MGNRDNLLLGRVSGARKLCEDLSVSHNHSLRVNRWARFANWVLGKLHNALKDNLDGIK